MQIELSVSGKTIAVDLNADLDTLRLVLAPLQFEEEADPEMRRVYFKAFQDGFTVSYDEDGSLTLFLHLEAEDGRDDVFTGSTTHLSSGFFANPGAEQFESQMLQQGFQRWPRIFPNAIDMVMDGLRIRFETRPMHAMVVIDDGARLRP